MVMTLRDRSTLKRPATSLGAGDEAEMRNVLRRLCGTDVDINDEDDDEADEEFKIPSDQGDAVNDDDDDDDDDDDEEEEDSTPSSSTPKGLGSERTDTNGTNPSSAETSEEINKRGGTNTKRVRRRPNQTVAADDNKAQNDEKRKTATSESATETHHKLTSESRISSHESPPQKADDTQVSREAPGEASSEAHGEASSEAPGGAPAGAPAEALSEPPNSESQPPQETMHNKGDMLMPPPQGSLDESADMVKDVHTDKGECHACVDTSASHSEISEPHEQSVRT